MFTHVRKCFQGTDVYTVGVFKCLLTKGTGAGAMDEGERWPYEADFLSNLEINSDKVIIVGDFNIHVDVENDGLATAFKSLLD